MSKAQFTASQAGVGVQAALREVMVERAPQVLVGGVGVGGAGRGGDKRDNDNECTAFPVGHLFQGHYL